MILLPAGGGKGYEKPGVMVTDYMHLNPPNIIVPTPMPMWRYGLHSEPFAEGEKILARVAATLLSQWERTWDRLEGGDC